MREAEIEAAKKKPKIKDETKRPPEATEPIQQK
jgi:hypothetical protein